MYCTEYGHTCCDEAHSIGSVHAVIWQAGTNWADSVRIQIYYGPEWICYETICYLPLGILESDLSNSKRYSTVFLENNVYFWDLCMRFQLEKSNFQEPLNGSQKNRI